MLKNYIIQNSNRFLSRWIVLLFDLSLVILCFPMAILLRYNFELAEGHFDIFIYKVPLLLVAYALSFLLMRSHVGVIRHTSIEDALAVFKGAFLASLVLLLLALSGSGEVRPYHQWLVLPSSIIIIQFSITLFTLVGSRLAVKLLFHKIQNGRADKRTRVLVYGAGASGIITKNTLISDTSRDYLVLGFIDDNPSKIGKSIEGKPIHSAAKALEQSFIEKNKVTEVIISIQETLTKSKRSKIVEKCLQLGLRVKVVPPVNRWIQGELSAKQIKAVRIEDLLEREPIQLDKAHVQRELKGKIVMVTGAAGSIGSEIVRQVMAYEPRQVLLLDMAESALYDLEFELKSKYSDFCEKAVCTIADVRDRERLDRIFRDYKPQIIFHAAAYKHVPLMEANPYEAVSVNVLGTKNVADLAVAHAAQKFVMVSTDKAVNPTNVMGATKRTAELYTQSLGARQNNRIQFITTRFGNVLGSNGSVIPIFRKQIQAGGPITITHRDITRYFMTIPEACNLVLEAGAMGKGGEIFVFDMGKSVKIIDLAKKMIQLSGLHLGRDIEIKEVGLRPGEKLYEELLASKENNKQTHHKKIMIAQTEEADYPDLLLAISRLSESLSSGDDHKLVGALKRIVPEYLSQNSEFEALDLKTAQGSL